jgi:hypothetical protein
LTLDRAVAASFGESSLPSLKRCECQTHTCAELQEMIMLRKLSLVAAAALTLGAAALAPSAASAHWHGGGYGGWHGGYGGWHRPYGYWGGPRVYAGGYGYGGCYTRRLVPTPWGPRWRLINRCY